MGKYSVFSGNREKTSGGLKKSDLTKNKNGKVVAKSLSANGKKSYKHIKAWTEACQKAKSLASRVSWPSRRAQHSTRQPRPTTMRELHHSIMFPMRKMRHHDPYV